MWKHSTTQSMRPQKSRDQLGDTILCDFFDKISKIFIFLRIEENRKSLIYLVWKPNSIGSSHKKIFAPPVTARNEKIDLKVGLSWLKFRGWVNNFEMYWSSINEWKKIGKNDFLWFFPIKIQFQSKQKVYGPHVEGIWALDEKIDRQKVRKWTVQNYEIGWSTRIRLGVGCPRIHSFS